MTTEPSESAAPQPHPQPVVLPWIGLLRTNQFLIKQCFAEISDQDARFAPPCRGEGSELNSLIFLALHMLDARAYLVRLAGGDGDHAFSPLTRGARSQSDLDLAALPSLPEVLAELKVVHRRLETTLAGVSEEQLAAEVDFPAPLPDKSLLGVLAFLSQHDSYHLGQLAYIRRLLGYPPMSYT
ncbi:MAG: DinB family protein [Acidobacteriota bacterium]